MDDESSEGGFMRGGFGANEFPDSSRNEDSVVMKPWCPLMPLFSGVQMQKVPEKVQIPDLQWEPCLFKDPCPIPLDSSKVSQFTDVRNLSTAL